MKKIIQALALVLSVATTTSAEAASQIFIYNDQNDEPVYGMLRRLSPNGRWAAGGDEMEDTGGILVDTDNPTEPILVPGGFFLDVDNNGLAVGVHYRVEGYAKYRQAGIYRDGEWIDLPLPAEILGQSCAVAISADSKTIAGHGMCANESPDEPGRYFPIIWKLNDETGEYDLHRLYNNLYLPGTSGFFIEDMTPDARYVCGYHCLDMGDIIAAMLNIETGEYKIWHDIEYRDYVEEFNGMVYMMRRMFVDGFLDGIDGEQEFNGMFVYATDRYLYGSRTEVLDVNEDGSGTLLSVATAYDLQSGEFVDGEGSYIYSCGINDKCYFTNDGYMIKDGKDDFITNTLGIEGALDLVYGVNDDNNMLVGSFLFSTGFGDIIESPVLVKLDQSIIAGIGNVAVTEPGATVLVKGRTLSVVGATDVKVYTPGGSLVSTKARAELTPGVYVVVADGHSHKIVIK